VFTGKIEVAGKKVGVLISGGNVDLPRFAELLSAAG
jgi:threonine dehydratase